VCLPVGGMREDEVVAAGAANSTRSREKRAGQPARGGLAVEDGREDQGCACTRCRVHALKGEEAEVLVVLAAGCWLDATRGGAAFATKWAKRGGRLADAVGVLRGGREDSTVGARGLGG